MEVLLWFLRSQSVYTASIVIVFVAMALSKYGIRLLANWLGITDRNARRLYGGLVIAMWLVFYVLRFGLRSIL